MESGVLEADFQELKFYSFFAKNFWIVKNSFYLCFQTKLDAFKTKAMPHHLFSFRIIMDANFLNRITCLLFLGAALSCTTLDLDAPDIPEQPSLKKIDFPVTVTREGEQIPQAAIATKGGPRTKASSYSSSNMIATMDTDRSFGIIGLDQETHALLIDNKPVYSGENGYTGLFDSGLWELPSVITFSAYYPYVSNIAYEDSYERYTIPFSVEETEAGPLVSKTVQRAVDQLNFIPLEFQHITNDIGFKICDVTTDPQLQGLLHLRKVTATNVASAGVFVNDLVLNHGIWHRQGYYRDQVVFEGDALVGVGMDNEKFIGENTLVDHMVDSHRYYAIPDEILLGKQCVEVEYDVDSFTIGGYTYEAMPGQVVRYMLYGLLPNNVFEYGKQYTFHLGLDTGRLYNQIAFSASVGEWETKIYENNEDF